jgi:hypothetical protein
LTRNTGQYKRGQRQSCDEQQRTSHIGDTTTPWKEKANCKGLDSTSRLYGFGFIETQSDWVFIFSLQTIFG